MGRQGVLRTRKDGGTSICYAPEDKVGKRRCCHVMDNASIKVQKSGSTNFINISGQVNGKNTSFDIEASEDKIKHYISDLSNGLSKTEKQGILDALRKKI